jgi:hypothetical protein
MKSSGLVQRRLDLVVEISGLKPSLTDAPARLTRRPTASPGKARNSPAAIDGEL